MTKTIEEVADDLDAGDGSTGDSETKESDKKPKSEGGNTVKDMLMSTSPSPRLEEVENPFNPEMGERRLMRAFQKMTDSDGLPAIVEVFISLLEIAIKRGLLFNNNEQQSNQQSNQQPQQKGGTNDRLGN